jgi:glycosyltransferase involved in cell wall biosynthesis
MARILQLVTDTDRRGAQVFACDLHEAFVALGLDVSTVALARGEIGGLDLPVLGPSRRSLTTIRAVRRMAADADAVIAHGSTTLPVCALALLGSGTPFVYRQISDVVFWTSTRLRRWRVKVALRRADRIVALWDGAARTITERFGVRPNRVRVIPNGVPAHRFSPPTGAEVTEARSRFGLASEARVVAYVGALVSEKGVDVVVDAAARCPGLELLIVGDGVERVELERKARTLAADRVHFVGSIPEARPAYAAADAVVLASRGGDSMPATLIEAALMGRPAAATAIEAIPEIVVDGSTGYIVPVDDTHGLARALDELTSSRARTHELGERAREHCQVRFTIDVVAERWAELVLAVVRDRNGGIGG